MSALKIFYWMDGWMDECFAIIVDIGGWISSRKTKCRVKSPRRTRVLFQFWRKVVHFFNVEKLDKMHFLYI
jgi:hypothetical protein